MTEAEMKQRTRKFALDTIMFIQSLPKDMTSAHIGRQLLRSATSVAANYRAACRARSAAEMCSKLGIVEEEADESQFWLELLEDAHCASGDELVALKGESEEILKIVVASIKTLRVKLAVREDELPYRATPNLPAEALS